MVPKITVTITVDVNPPSGWTWEQIAAEMARRADEVTGQISGTQGGSVWLMGVNVMRSE